MTYRMYCLIAIDEGDPPGGLDARCTSHGDGHTASLTIAPGVTHTEVDHTGRKAIVRDLCGAPMDIVPKVTTYEAAATWHRTHPCRTEIEPTTDRVAS